MEDDAQSVWLYLACGLVRVGRSELDAWTSHPKRTIKVTVFDSSDGVSSHRFSGAHNSVIAKSADGKLWFVRPGGVSVIDPHHLAFNTLPPPVHIEQVTADDKTYEATTGLRLPPRIRDLAIDYTALSLAAPNKVRFRFKLEGQNRNWHEVVNDRQVQYRTSLRVLTASGVVASNNSGVWNEDGRGPGLLDRAGVYQTRWFEALVVAGAFALYVGGRIAPASVRSLGDYQRRLDERVNERTRIARELHDTLLQSFHGLLLRFQTALYCCQIARHKRKSNSLVRLNTRRRRSRRGAMPCRDCGPPPSKRTTSLWRSASLGEELAADGSARPSDRHSTLPSKARRESSIRFFVTRSTSAAEALRNAFRHAHAGRSRSRSATTTSNSACACAMMARGSIRRCSPTRGSRDTTACAACRNALP